MVTDKISTLITISNILFIVGIALLFISIYLFKTDDYVSFFKMQKGDTGSRKKNLDNEVVKDKVNVYDTSGLSSESLSTKLEKIEKSNNEKIQNMPKRQTSFNDINEEEDVGFEETTYLASEQEDSGDNETSVLMSSEDSFIVDSGDVVDDDLKNELKVEDENEEDLDYADRLIDNNGSDETSDLSEEPIVLNESSNKDYIQPTEQITDYATSNPSAFETDYVGSVLYEDDGSDETQVLSQEKIVSRVKNKKQRRIINDWGGSDKFVKSKDDNVVITHTDERIIY